MVSRFSRAGWFVLLCGSIALGANTAEAASIGANLRVHAHNIPHAVAGGHHPHAGMGSVRAQGPLRPHTSTRNIQLDGAGETTAIKSRK